MFTSEKQFTQRASNIVYEEVYFNSDMTENNYDNSTGYRLKYPELFSANNSQDKCIAPRKVNVKPSANQLKFTFVLDSFYNKNANIAIDVTPYNTMQEVLNEMKNQISSQNNGLYQMQYIYNTMSGILVISFIDENDELVEFKFEFTEVGNDGDLWEFFNQPGLPQFPTANYVDSIALSNVWNRDYLYVHASFSNSKYHYLCTTNDNWEYPTKLFYDNVFGYDFYIYFTTDGITKIIPYYANKLIELSFVLRKAGL